MQMKEEWRSVAMKCGEPSGMEGGTATMLLLFADNLDSIRPTQVYSGRSVAIYSMYCYLNAGIEVYCNSYFGAGTGPILFAYLNCGRSESSLYGCSRYSSYNFGASHSRDAGVRCQRPAISGKLMLQ